MKRDIYDKVLKKHNVYINIYQIYNKRYNINMNYIIKI